MRIYGDVTSRIKRNLTKLCRPTYGCQAYCLTGSMSKGSPVKQSDTSCASERIRYVANYVCLNIAQDANEIVHLAHFLSSTDASTLGSTGGVIFFYLDGGGELWKFLRF